MHSIFFFKNLFYQKQFQYAVNIGLLKSGMPFYSSASLPDAAFIFWNNPYT